LEEVVEQQFAGQPQEIESIPRAAIMKGKLRLKRLQFA
jgi:hypothetical protein